MASKPVVVARARGSAPDEFRELVAIIDHDDGSEDDAQSISELIAAGIAQANREGRHADSAALHLLALRLGDLHPALTGARAAAGGPLADALAVLDDLI